jgi:hypothetical protein
VREHVSCVHLTTSSTSFMHATTHA